MTRQIRDVLIYNEEEYYLNQEYLERFFEECPDKIPKDFHPGGFSACWRGYVASFELIEKQLYVREIRMITGSQSDETVLDEMFPNEHKFDWFTGLIRIDEFRGEYDDEDNPEAIFELLEIVDGKLKNIWKMNYEDFNVFKQIQFEYFKSTAAYDTLYSKWKNNNPGISDTKVNQYIAEDIIRNSRELY